MTTLYLDTFSGISGDMLLGLLVDLGIDLDTIKNELDDLPLSGYELTAHPDQRHNIGGTRVTVTCVGDQPHRTWTDIDRMLVGSSLAKPIWERARQVFRRLGEAEAIVHRIPLEQVHFHEVGAIDAIVDIVGSIIGLQKLQVDEVFCGPLPLSHGLARGQHGPLPLPAPATLEILKGQPVRASGCDLELTTPTGAALAATLGTFGPLPEMTVERIGYGVGGWQLDDRPNLLRGLLGQVRSSSGFQYDTVSVIETHLDDTLPEWLGSLMDRLLTEGALDVGYSPLQMKKNRPGVRVTVIATPGDTDRLASLLLFESTAIGVRIHETRRRKLRRETRTIETEFGPVAIKLIYEGNSLLRITPEHSSCQVLATETGRPLPEIHRLVSAAANRRFGLE